MPKPLLGCLTLPFKSTHKCFPLGKTTFQICVYVGSFMYFYVLAVVRYALR